MFLLPQYISVLGTWTCIVVQRGNWHIPFLPLIVISLLSLHGPHHLVCSFILNIHISCLFCTHFAPFPPSFLPPCLSLLLAFLYAEGRHKWVWAASTALCPPVHQHARQLQVHVPAGTPPAGGRQILRWPGASAQLWKLLIWLPNIRILSWAQLIPATVPQLGLPELPQLHRHLKEAQQEPETQSISRTAGRPRLPAGVWVQGWLLLR